MNIDAIWVLKKEMDVLRKDKEILIKENILLKEQLHNFVFTKTLANGDLIQIDDADNIKITLCDPDYEHNIKITLANGELIEIIRESITKYLTNGEIIQIEYENDIIKDLTNGEKIYIDNFNLIQKTLTNEEFKSGFQGSIYPNPANDTLYVNCGKLDRNYSFKLIDLLGKTIITKSFEMASQNEAISISEIPKGVYLAVIESDGNNYTKKIIIN